MTHQHTASLRNQHVSNGIAVAHPITVSRAAGAYLWDDQGKKYLDFVGGIGVLNVGHNHPRVVEAFRKQLDCFSHIGFQVAAYDQTRPGSRHRSEQGPVLQTFCEALS